MIDEQSSLSVTPDALVDRVRDLRDQNYRLVQIGATPLPDQVELNYGFDLDGRYLNLRLQLPAAGARVPSITGIYWCAFIYENELHDLFNIQVDGIALDYKGQFYRLATPFPFAKPAPAAADTTLIPLPSPAAEKTPPAVP